MNFVRFIFQFTFDTKILFLKPKQTSYINQQSGLCINCFHTSEEHMIDTLIHRKVESNTICFLSV
ncbi:unnamed protein product [Schistosoma curassoni]|uniref:Ovule protein n=1 Tax=Schistosoma curassoni TaxID=6186 RepID=A0A183JKN3_9TREM|nr:unnamed protein product [Schistosoma curassoni]